ncbi:hypothetical protein M2283_009827 [Streptomyces pseudovenezuelae]|uniref:Triacylglycerol lipase n=1 Tax=Streptomyces pseudovenezuelae TaxID=67350 RepID=A0ABT6M3A8_9ACTN|nr:hypothetical protein [Streptomyces pseudovenezuelae]
MGQGDQCAASLGLENPLSLNGRTVSVGYENAAIHRFLATGAAVVVTDYAGLGATYCLHTYVNRLDEAHAVLDAVRAARSLPGTSVTSESRVGLFGYSQGGGATAAAAELQSSYAPDITLAGSYSGAPPADLTAVTKGIDGSEPVGALAWSLNGFLQSGPTRKPIAEAHLNATGRAAMTDLSPMCVRASGGAVRWNSTPAAADGRDQQGRGRERVTKIVQAGPAVAFTCGDVRRVQQLGKDARDVVGIEAGAAGGHQEGDRTGDGPLEVTFPGVFPQRGGGAGMQWNLARLARPA